MRRCLLACVLLAGCSREAPPAPQPPASCPTWTDLRDGACVLRPWSLPTWADAAGESGARLRTLAIDGTGLGLATWDVALPGRPGVELGEELSPGVWVVRDPTARIGGANASPVVAGGPDGAALLTWVHTGGAPGIYAAERDRWGRWTDPARGEVRSFAGTAVEPWAAISPTGEQLLVWCQQTRTGWGVSVSRRPDAQAAWERPRDAEDVVSPPILFANQPQIAMNARGEALLAWYQSEGAPLMTYASERRSAGGAFSRPGAHDHLSLLGGPVASDPVRNPIPALGPNGQAAVVWTQEKEGGITPAYLAIRDGSGAWTKPRDPKDTLTPANGVSQNVQAAFDPSGELWVAVGHTLHGRSSVVLAGKRGAEGVWSLTAISSSGKNAYGPSLAVGPDGGVVVAWIEEEGPRKSRVVARRAGGDRSGWTAIEALSGPDTRPTGAPIAAAGPRDRAVVGWSAGTLRDTRVVFARVE